MKLRILKKIDSISIIITVYFQYFVFLSDKSKLYKSKLCIETAPNFFSMSYRYRLLPARESTTKAGTVSHEKFLTRDGGEM